MAAVTVVLHYKSELVYQVELNMVKFERYKDQCMDEQYLFTMQHISEQWLLQPCHIQVF